MRAFKQRRDKFIGYVQRNIQYLKKRNAMIALKKQDLKFWFDGIQISTIVVSTLLTCLETVKAEMDWNQSENLTLRRAMSLSPMFLSSYIALVIAIAKFKRLQEKLEEMSKVAERTNHVICRLRRVQEDAHNTSDDRQLQMQKTTYSKQTFDLFMSVRQALDDVLRFQDVVKYKRKYALLTLRSMHASQATCDADAPWYCSMWRCFCCCRKRVDMTDPEDPLGAGRGGPAAPAASSLPAAASSLPAATRPVGTNPASRLTQRHSTSPIGALASSKGEGFV